MTPKQSRIKNLQIYTDCTLKVTTVLVKEVDLFLIGNTNKHPVKTACRWIPTPLTVINTKATPQLQFETTD